LRVDGLTTEWAWRIASLIGFFTSVVVCVGALRRDRTRRRLPGYNRFTMVTNFAIMGIVVTALGGGLTGIAGPYVGSIFVGSLILMLVGCSTAFILVVTSFLEPPPRKDSSAQ
jgi:hypothetical protein